MQQACTAKKRGRIKPEKLRTSPLLAEVRQSVQWLPKQVQQFCCSPVEESPGESWADWVTACDVYASAVMCVADGELRFRNVPVCTVDAGMINGHLTDIVDYGRQAGVPYDQIRKIKVSKTGAFLLCDTKMEACA